ncbi:ABC transporter substrate-binding protein [Halobellus litoreus]|uniref:ABC transporter substrate-binding protein n=1 Tax=Halobellus litoreus TaxID=755310 RepID=A0ABD6DP89_9EURY|nr:ABC transporter substrate-binding protein [Halobellus litoreus]
MAESSKGCGVRRREMLGALGAGAAASVGGCLRRARSIAGWESMERVSLRIKTLPADADPYALHTARALTSWYQAAGIDAQVVPVSEEELLRQVLLSKDFDIFLIRTATIQRDPDIFYPLLHSRFADARGRQNPFGYTDLDVDEWLERQRRATGERRREIVAELQRSIARSQPFTVIGFPDEIRAARRANYTNWRSANLRAPQGYLTLKRGGEGPSETNEANAGDEEAVLRVVGTDRRATENLNPLSVEYRRSGVLTGLLYDSLGRVTSEGTTPWLAASWAFSETGDDPRAAVRLRSGQTWHDGEPLTAEDIAFTYALLADTSLGSSEGQDGETAAETRVPAPRFQGRSGLVEDVQAAESDVAVFRFRDCSPRVATRAFTVPILPKHVWQARTGPASISGIEVGSATEALVTNNIPPVGSGPLRFVQNTPRESLVLETTGNHFLFDERDAGEREVVGPPEFDRLEIQVVGSDDAAVGVVAEGDADVTGTPVGADTVPRIGRTGGLELLVNRSAAPYIVGYNTQIPPLTNPRFRHTLARLVDRSHIAADVFNGYARPAVSLLEGTEWVPDDLRWDGTDPVTPFLGTEGELNIPQVRSEFRNAGFQYEAEKLVRMT